MKKQYKQLKGNGTHKAVGEFRGVFIEEKNRKYLVLLDGTKVPCKFVSKAAGKKVYKDALGPNIFRGYPQFDSKKGRLKSIEITAINPTTRIVEDLNRWVFLGLWGRQGLLVQQSAKVKKAIVRAEHAGYLPCNCFQFINSKSFPLKELKLYNIVAELNRGTFTIVSVNAL